MCVCVRRVTFCLLFPCNKTFPHSDMARTLLNIDSLESADSCVCDAISFRLALRCILIWCLVTACKLHCHKSQQIEPSHVSHIIIANYLHKIYDAYATLLRIQNWNWSKKFPFSYRLWFISTSIEFMIRFFFSLRYKLFAWSVWVFALKWHGFCRHASNQMTKKNLRDVRSKRRKRMKCVEEFQRDFQCNAPVFLSVGFCLLSNESNAPTDKCTQFQRWRSLKSNQTHWRMKFHFILLANERVCCVHFCTVLYIIKIKRSIKCNNNTAKKRAVLFTEVFFVL